MRRKQAADALLDGLEFVATVAGERLVRAVARQRDGDALAGQRADLVCRQRRGVGEGFVEARDERVDQRYVARLDTRSR